MAKIALKRIGQMLLVSAFLCSATGCSFMGTNVGPLLPVASSDSHSAEEDSGYTWGIFGGELVLMAGGALLFNTDTDTGGTLAALILTSLAVGIGGGMLADKYKLSPTVPRALHGAGWTGLQLYLAGDLMSDSELLPLALAGLGAMAGGAVGTWGVDTVEASRAWMWNPILGTQILIVAAPVKFLCCGQGPKDGTKVFLGSFGAATALSYGFALAD